MLFVWNENDSIIAEIRVMLKMLISFWEWRAELRFNGLGFRALHCESITLVWTEFLSLSLSLSDSEERVVAETQAWFDWPRCFVAGGLWNCFEHLRPASLLPTRPYTHTDAGSGWEGGMRGMKGWIDWLMDGWWVDDCQTGGRKMHRWMNRLMDEWVDWWTDSLTLVWCWCVCYSLQCGRSPGAGFRTHELNYQIKTYPSSRFYIETSQSTICVSKWFFAWWNCSSD